MAKQYKPVVARCIVAAGGNVNAGILLYRINFWMRHAKIQHGGRTFSANSAKNWCTETELTYDKYRRAIAHLKSLGLVETEQHLFGGKNITHVRITDAGRLAIANATPGACTSASSISSKGPLPKSGEDAQLLIHGVSSLEVLIGGSTLPLASAHGMGLPNQGQEEVTGKIEKKKDNPEDLNNAAEKCAAAAPSSPSGLADLWRVTIATYCPPHYVPPVTPKELAQFKKIIAACPPGLAHTVITECIKDWWVFCKSAKAHSGAYSLPEVPTVGFLLKWIAAAVDFALSKQVEISASTPEPPLPKPAIKTTKTPLKAKAGGEQPATKEELYAILNGEDDDP